MPDVAFTALDAAIGRIAQLRAGWTSDAHELQVRPVAQLPLAIGPGSSRGVVLRADTWAELGGPDTASVSTVLLTGARRQVQDGRITLAGPDIPDIRGAAVPFAQVVLVAGAELSAADLPGLVDAQYVRDAIEGYMVRSRAQHVWGRVERDAVARGFDFTFLGSALAHLYRSRQPRIDALEVLFATRESYVRALEPVAAEASALASDLRNGAWARRGIDPDCRVGVHCGACGDSAVCAEIRRVAHLRDSATT